MFEERNCDRCEATIVDSIHKRPHIHNIVLTDGDGDDMVYEEHQRELCRKCEEAFLAWVDDDSVSASNRVDLPHVDYMSYTLEELGSELTDIADKLQAHNASGPQPADD